MKKLDRRTLLGCLAATSATTALVSCTGTQQQAAPVQTPKPVPTNVFTVLLHGMAGALIDEQGKRIRLFVPEVDGHTYAIGAFKRPSQFAGSWKLDVQYDPAGPAPTSPYANSMFNTLNAVADLNGKIPNSARVVDLPFPNYGLQRLRVVPVTAGTGGKFFNGGLEADPTEMPLLYGFSYQYTGTPTATGIKVDWDVSKDGNLHIWCNSGVVLDMQGHFKMAVDAFNKMTGLSLIVGDGTKQYVGPMITDPPISGIEMQPDPPPVKIGGATAANNRGGYAGDCWAIFLKA